MDARPVWTVFHLCLPMTASSHCPGSLTTEWLPRPESPASVDIEARKPTTKNTTTTPLTRLDTQMTGPEYSGQHRSLLQI
ncbi:uncharacterized protein BO80DRAFT_421468 [Aspergillus ibericus CBS 121593]|uniref:Secreted protein n=1 Tax=Aspergillus ibericus CBS 121593 TaxID=1448316 RepID=A0A395HD93_9EURO|nr:hypothetical protein BO80DRAFT_421468 [Aspergillus ibericus CBS 121593]RAL05433.1 hypothetical protein BO80DRAFT_421468 [Aspergillus ibericus CBS 121593]